MNDTFYYEDLRMMFSLGYNETATQYLVDDLKFLCVGHMQDKGNFMKYLLVFHDMDDPETHYGVEPHSVEDIVGRYDLYMETIEGNFINDDSWKPIKVRKVKPTVKTIKVYEYEDVE